MADNGAIISGLYASFAKGDVPAVLGELDPNVEWREADPLPHHMRSVAGSGLSAGGPRARRLARPEGLLDGERHQPDSQSESRRLWRRDAACLRPQCA